MAKKKQKLSADQVVQQLKSRYPGKIFSAKDYSMPWVMKRLPTGIIDLDIALNGGFPAGGLSFLIGKQGVGKSWMANQIIREQQLLYGDECNVAWISTECRMTRCKGNRVE